MRRHHVVRPLGVAVARTEVQGHEPERVDLDPVSAGNTLSYAGLSYRWRALTMSAQVEKGARVRYAFSLGTRF